MKRYPAARAGEMSPARIGAGGSKFALEAPPEGQRDVLVLRHLVGLTPT
jgi:hypothetical protein